ncbi:MAG TPA: class I SAM-dependent methyltransferase [Aggregatilineaceae bacterium]|nr:class I SAM-dependent methyltransferase [Aggregatilineaceae bacterium]
MVRDAIQLEERRLEGVDSIEQYPSFHERHRIFPALFEDRHHQHIIDFSAGVGCAAERIKNGYPADLICNDITPAALAILQKLGLNTVSFDLDNDQTPYPFEDGHFDAAVSLATIEHLMHPDYFLKEVNRLLSDGGYFYISAPNYASIIYLNRILFKGESFHNPLSKNERTRYEFYAHIRYFTYKTLKEFVSAHGFVPIAVYMPVPAGSTHYLKMREASRLKAFFYRYGIMSMYRILSPRWAPEPVFCFQKGSATGKTPKFRKILL